MKTIEISYYLYKMITKMLLDGIDTSVEDDEKIDEFTKESR